MQLGTRIGPYEIVAAIGSGGMGEVYRARDTRLGRDVPIVETTPEFKVGTPKLLFTPRPDLTGLVATSDLKRFLAAVPVEGTAPASVQLTLNWQAALER